MAKTPSRNDGLSAADRNRKIRQEALREQLSKQKLVEQVVDIAKKLNNLEIELEAGDVTRLKAAADINLKLIVKYLPDLKQTELIGDPDQPLLVNTKELSDEQLAAIIAKG